MIEVPATEFTRNFGRYCEAAQREAAGVKVHDRVTGYFSSAQAYQEYQRLKAMTPVAMVAKDLDHDTLGTLSDAKMDQRHTALDHLMD